MPIDPEDQVRLDKVTEYMRNPSCDPGEGFSLPVLIIMFRRIVDLKDAIEAQVAINQQLSLRLRILEIKLGAKTMDVGEVYLKLSG